MLKATFEGDEGAGVMLPMAVHWSVVQEVQVIDPIVFE